MTDAESQDTIRAILADYLDPEDLPHGAYAELLARLETRDIILRDDAMQIARRDVYRAVKARLYRELYMLPNG